MRAKGRPLTRVPSRLKKPPLDQFNGATLILTLKLLRHVLLARVTLTWQVFVAETTAATVLQLHNRPKPII